MSDSQSHFNYLADTRVSLQTKKALLRQTLTPEQVPALIGFIAGRCQPQLARDAKARRIFTALLAQQDFADKLNYLTGSTRLTTLFSDAGATRA